MMHGPTTRTLDEALWRYGSLTKLAAKLGVTTGYLCDVRKGRRVPSQKLAEDISRETGVPLRTLRRAA